MMDRTMKVIKHTNKKLIATLLVSFLFLSACQQHKTKSYKNQVWKLIPESSSISIITTKNNKVSEVSNFKTFSGKISQTNYLEIEIDLNSLETNIPIRNQRISKHLFQTDIFPTALIHTQLKAEGLTQGIHTVTFDVDLHGVSGIVEAEFMVFEYYSNKVVILHKPLIIQAKMFGLENGITKLKEMAKLQSINFTVPVDITLTFE